MKATILVPFKDAMLDRRFEVGESIEGAAETIKKYEEYGFVEVKAEKTVKSEKVEKSETSTKKTTKK